MLSKVVLSVVQRQGKASATHVANASISVLYGASKSILEPIWLSIYVFVMGFSNIVILKQVQDDGSGMTRDSIRNELT